MVTFIFKVYKKLIKLFFLYIKILTGYYQKNKDKLSKKNARETYQEKKKKRKSANMLVSNIETALKKKKKRRVNMDMKDIKAF